MKDHLRTICVVCFMVLGFGTMAGQIASCTVAEVSAAVREQAYSVDKDVAMALLVPVSNRALDYADEDEELRMAVADAMEALNSFDDTIPGTAAIHVAVVCDAHDLLVLTEPTPPRFIDHYLRSTEILRALFEAANEPILNGT